MSERMIFIGIDDTDLPGTRGTGRLARCVAGHLECHGVGGLRGVTRHQLLVHPSIPFTSHNSAACIALESDEEPTAVFDVCKALIKAHAIPGSDPGLCIAARSQVSGEVVDFGRRAQKFVLDLEHAREIAVNEDILAEALGQGRQGIIGAMAAAGLRASGEDGRFIELEGIRQVSGLLSVREIKERTGVTSVSKMASLEMAGDCIVDTQDWLRPRLVDHKAVLVVEPHPKLSGHWISIDRRNSASPQR